MPYKVVKDGDQYCVQKEDGTAVKGGCHSTKADAEAMMKAIYANENKAAQTKERLFDQSEVNYTPVSMQMGKACAGCRWFEPAENWSDENRTPSCHLVYAWPQSIQPTGYCDRYEVYPAPQPLTQAPMPVVIVDPSEIESDAAELKDDKPKKSFEDRLRDGLKALGILKDEDDPISGFKVFDNHYLCVWSNNFKDRDGEIFTEKAIDDYIARVDMGVVLLPELWVWHIPGTRIGQAEFVARHGHFVVSVGTFDDTSDGRAAQAYYSKHAGEKGISHGYQYPRNRYDGKHYHSFNTFENSPLPLGAEANLYTSLEGVKETKVDERKQQELEKVFGKERAAQILANLDERGKALESLGVEFKDFVDPNPDPANANKEAVELANKSLVDLFPDLIEGQSETISAVMTLTKQVKQVLADNAELRKELDAAKADVTAIRDGAPRASQSSKTVVKENDPLAKKSQLGLTPEQERLAEAMPGLFKQG